MPVLVTCKFEKDLVKNNREKVEITPVMLHIKFDQDWPTGFSSSKLWTTTDGQRTIGIL